MDAIIFEPSGLRDKVTTSIVDAAASSAEKIISSEGITVAWDTTVTSPWAIPAPACSLDPRPGLGHQSRNRARQCEV